MTVFKHRIVAFCLLASACSGPPPRVEAITLVNGTGYDVGVEVTDGDREAWLPLATVEAESERTSEQVIDQGDTWIFRFVRSGEPVGELTLTRSELERDRWRVEVPEEVADTLETLEGSSSR